MARPLRLEFPGALWHVMSRGNEKRRIFRDDRDYDFYMQELIRVVSDFRWRLYAHNLMPNHYHLLLETVETNLSRGMQSLNGRYAQHFNWRHERCGHLFQSRFKALLVEEESYLLQVSRYIVLNPVCAGLVNSPEEWRWTSYRATAGLEPVPQWLDIQPVLDQFRAPTRELAQVAYRNFVMEGLGIEAPPIGIAGQFCLGSEAFRHRVHEMAVERESSRDLPKRDFKSLRPDLSQIVAAVTVEFGLSVDELRLCHGGEARILFAYIARHDGLLSLEETGFFLNLTPGAASILTKKGEQLEQDSSFQARLRSVRRRLDDSPYLLEKIKD